MKLACVLVKLVDVEEDFDRVWNAMTESPSLNEPQVELTYLCKNEIDGHFDILVQFSARSQEDIEGIIIPRILQIPGVREAVFACLLNV